MKTTPPFAKVKIGSSTMTCDSEWDYIGPGSRPPKNFAFRDIESSEPLELGDTSWHFHQGINNFEGDGGISNYLEAARHFHQGALQGDVELTKFLGQMYMLGLGVPLDEVEGLRLLTYTAGLGDSDSQFLVGEFLLDQHESFPNRLDGIKWLLKAAASNDSRAQFMLGECYTNGNGVKVDPRKALAWYRQAAQGDHNLDAIVKVGICHLSGIGTVIDTVEARHLFKVAAELGSPAACFYLGLFHLGGTAPGAILDEKIAFKWFELGAFGGDADSVRHLQECYKKGVGVEKNMRLSNRWANNYSEYPRITDLEVKLARLRSSMQS